MVKETNFDTLKIIRCYCSIITQEKRMEKKFEMLALPIVLLN